MILCIETSTTVCSVALCNREGVVSIKEENGGKSHAAMLTLFIEELFKENSLKAGDLEAVVVSKGPGSYTGLRIGVSVAKGIAFGSSLPLIAVETTLSMLHGFIDTYGAVYSFREEDLFAPVLDARRMEVYTSILKFNGEVVKKTNAEIITEESFPELNMAPRSFIFGDGATKCIGVLTSEKVVIEPGYRVSAASMLKPAYRKIDNKEFEDVAYFEPFYLKDFIATIPVKNILR